MSVARRSHAQGGSNWNVLFAAALGGGGAFVDGRLGLAERTAGFGAGGAFVGFRLGLAERTAAAFLAGAGSLESAEWSALAQNSAASLRNLSSYACTNFWCFFAFLRSAARLFAAAKRSAWR